MKLIRVMDILFSFFGLIIGFPLILSIYVLCWFDTRSPFFLQERVGIHKRPFRLIKFRTMAIGTPSVASHLASSTAVTRIGRFLRKSKLDELPQLLNVLIGEMSLVGPRPCLFSQTELITERDRLCVFSVRPGVTGLAQIRGIDMSTPEFLAKTDAEMIKCLNLKRYFQLLICTALGKGRGDRVRST